VANPGCVSRNETLASYFVMPEEIYPQAENFTNLEYRLACHVTKARILYWTGKKLILLPSRGISLFFPHDKLN
jgi:hypothetical protein